MPQMKPMNWMILYLMLNLIIMLMNIMNYYFNNMLKFNNLKKNMKKKNLGWKW